MLFPHSTRPKEKSIAVWNKNSHCIPKNQQSYGQILQSTKKKNPLILLAEQISLGLHRFKRLSGKPDRKQKPQS